MKMKLLCNAWRIGALSLVLCVLSSCGSSGGAAAEAAASGTAQTGFLPRIGV